MAMAAPRYDFHFFVAQPCDSKPVDTMTGA
jgi:hypothetical protein